MIDDVIDEIAEDVRERVNADTNGDGEAADDILILSDRPLAESKQNQPEPIISGGLVNRRNATVVSSTGGLGKSLLFIQTAVEMTLKRAIWGCEALMPHGSKVLYVNGEDVLENTDYALARILPAYGLDHCPFDIFPVCETSRGEFPLTALNAARLADRINANSYDLVMFDTAISFMPIGTGFIDPLAIRSWLRTSVGLIQRRTRAGVMIAAHDNKVGQALSGPADWGNFVRLGLHLQRAESVDGQDVFTLDLVKSNLGWRFQRLTLTRDPHTLTSRVTAVQAIGERAAGKPTSPEDVKALLARIVRCEIIPLAEEKRTKAAVRSRLFAVAREHGVNREQVRDFVEASCQVRDAKLGRTWAKVVCNVDDTTTEVGS